MMKMGERAINNALFNAISSLLPLALSFIFWPYIVKGLGESSYGIFALIGSIIGYFALLDLGLGKAVVKYISEYVGQQNHALVKEVIGVALTIYIVAGLMGSLLILSIAKVLATHLLKIPPNLIDQAYLAFSVTAAGFFFTMLLTLCTAIIHGLNRYDISSVTTAIMGAVSTISAVILIRMGFGLIALVWLNVIVPMLVVIVYFFIIRKLIPGTALRFSFSKQILKQVLHFGAYAMLSRITNVIVHQVDLILIGTLLGVASVTYYVIPFTILNRLTALHGRIGMVILPAISELQGQRQPEKIQRLYLVASRIILSFAIAFTIPILIFGVHFLSLWMGPEFAIQGGTVMIIIAAGTLFDLCTHVPSYVVNGLGRPKISGLAALSQALLFLGFIIPGAKYWGITGVAAAYGLSLVIVAPFMITYVNRKVIGISMRQLWKDVYLRPILAGVLVTLPLLCIPTAGIQNIFLLIFVMGAGMGLYLLIALLIGVYQPHERQILLDYLTRITARFRTRSIA